MVICDFNKIYLNKAMGKKSSLCWDEDKIRGKEMETVRSDNPLKNRGSRDDWQSLEEDVGSKD